MVLAIVLLILKFSNAQLNAHGRNVLAKERIKNRRGKKIVTSY